MNTETGDVLRLASSAASTAASLAASAALASSPARAAPPLGLRLGLGGLELRLRLGDPRDGLLLCQLRLLGLLVLLALSGVSVGAALALAARACAPRPSAAPRPWRDSPRAAAASWWQALPRRPCASAAAWPRPPSWSPRPRPRTWPRRSISGSACAWPSPASGGTLLAVRGAKPDRRSPVAARRRSGRRGQRQLLRAGFGLKSLGWSMAAGGISSRTTITRKPMSVRPNSCWANACGRRTQPCEAGWPGSTPACSAMPVQVMRCMKGMLPSS